MVSPYQHRGTYNRSIDSFIQKEASSGKEAEDERIRVAEEVEAEVERQRFYASPEGQKQILFDALVDISGVSDKIARTLMDQYPTLESINKSSAEQLTDIPGVGMNVAKAIEARLG